MPTMVLLDIRLLLLLIPLNPMLFSNGVHENFYTYQALLFCIVLQNSLLKLQIYQILS